MYLSSALICCSRSTVLINYIPLWYNNIISI
nr:MAG TPA: hypothetical protein [Caudoviricetes sp.]